MNPTVHVVTGVCATVAGLFAFMQVTITSTPRLGWVARPWLVRAPMGLAGIAMICRGVTSLARHQEFNPLGAFVIWSLAVMFATELLVVMTTSFRGQAAEAARIAALTARPRAERQLFARRLRRLAPEVKRNSQEIDRLREETAWIRKPPATYGDEPPAD